MTDNGNADTIGDLFRKLGSVLNNVVYFLLGMMYQIFFNVASAQLFESETIKNFYGRIQLIIGVFMVFKLAVSILQGIMSPDQFSDPKSGFGNFITRVVVALALLTVLVPINVPDVENANSFEKYINNNGLLFGTLYSLQERILSNNTLGRLILGTTDEATSTSSADDSGMSEADRQTAMLERSSRIFASTILKGFLRINLLPAETRESDSETDSQNWYCGANLSDSAATALEAYQQLDVDPSSLLSDEILLADCEINDSILQSFGNFVSDVPLIGGLFEMFVGKSRYVFAFQWLGAFIVGIVFLVILVGFTVDIAIRSIKLAILRLIAPIPVISYIEPKSSKDGGMFSSWIKALTSTYLDLFLRLAIVYFVIFLIQDMIVNGVVINEAGGMVGIISFIFIMLGLFFFAKMAPKFIKDALGLKGAGMSNIGLSGILGGAAMAVGGGGLAGFAMGAMQGSDAAVKGEAQGKPMPLGAAWSQNSDMMAKIRTGDKDARGGFMGRAMDHLNYSTRERRAKMLGIGSQDLADADYMAKFAKAEAQKAQREFDAIKARYDRGDPGVTEADYMAAYDKNQEFQTRAAKAQSTYDKMDKDRGQMGVAPRISDKRMNKYTVRHRMNATFGTEFKEGSYRSPTKVTNDPFAEVDRRGIGASPTDSKTVVGTIQGHERDLTNFSGTTDDDSWSSSGHGGPGFGPGGPPPGP